MNTTNTFPTSIISGEGRLFFLLSTLDSKGLSRTTRVADREPVNLSWVVHLLTKGSTAFGHTVFSSFRAKSGLSLTYNLPSCLRKG